ncbi:MAG: hypothetical protein EOP53_26190 [Sphingobacteriales bacterium]|nr:MAG: hypothetical protein EOP53_26190 [Sphingobacteriales bacterium]
MKNASVRELILFVILCVISFSFLLSVKSCKRVEKRVNYAHVSSTNHQIIKRAVPVVQDID